MPPQINIFLVSSVSNALTRYFSLMSQLLGDNNILNILLRPMIKSYFRTDYLSRRVKHVLLGFQHGVRNMWNWVFWLQSNPISRNVFRIMIG